MPAEINTPVLVGPVLLYYVQNMTITEGYRIERIAGSSFSQAIAPTTKTIAIDAVLPGPTRLVVKKKLEVLALASRVLVAATAPALAAAGIPVVSGLTISLNMQITDLRFTANVQRRDAVDVAMTLTHVPRSSASEIASEIADMALAAGTALTSLPSAPNPVPRALGAPL
jgi:hypothetical protein